MTKGRTVALTEAALLAHLRQTTALNGETNAETPLFSSGALDSVSMLDLILFVERQAGIAIPAEHVTLEHFDTPARIMRFAQGQCP